MRATLPLVTAVVLAAAGCDFNPADVEWDADPRDAEPLVVDAAPPDSAPACAADTIDCDDASGTYVDCGSDGIAEVVIHCAMGCASGVEQCIDVDPSNNLAPYLDQARTDPEVPAVTFSGNSTLNTMTGAAFNGPTAIDVPSVDVAGVRVFLFSELTVLGTLKISGDRPIAILVDGDVSIEGLVDLSAEGATAGPGAIDIASCRGAGNAVTPLTTDQGAGGAGRYDPGGRGGNAGDGDIGYAGGAMLRDDYGVPLQGGCKGATMSNSYFPDFVVVYAEGGRGGGALQLVSRTSIHLTGMGRIDASGGGGQTILPSGSGALPGTGGGSGGMILLEAPEILLDGPSVVISTKGGGGSAAGDTTPQNGSDGGTDASPAAGGGGALAHGGNGGTESSIPGAGLTGVGANAQGGGGGGAVGQARFNARTAGVSPQNGAAIRSRYTNGVIGSRLIP